MSKIKRLFLNRGSSASYAIIAAIFTIIPEDLFKNGFISCNWSDSIIVLINRLLVCTTVFLLSNVFYCLWKRNRKAVKISDRTCDIVIEYGDLISIRKGKKIINFDECFSANVGDRPGEIKPNSICGQYLNQKPIDRVDIKKLIKKTGAQPQGKSRYMNKEAYAPGTLLQKDDFLLMAFVKLDEKGLGFHTYDSYLECLDRLWEEIDRYHGTDDVYLPILGSRITRFDKDLTQQELLDIMVASYRLSPKKLKKPNKLHVVCQERAGFSLNRIFGID